MIKFPSNISAALTGAIMTPILIAGVNYAEDKHYSQIVIFAMFIVGFLVPVLMTTFDFDHVRRSGGFFKPNIKDYRELFVPVWKRMALYFLFSVLSVVLLKFVGLTV